ncbi:Protein of unknown function (DUF3107) [Actinobacteria bacterium IMCC26207]|uniref:Unannotated protein n=1 Tax=freshwater metagenome TaxID=449393 RepID=A0A6J7UTJ9_9ZZZZ|nr:Protein of unknown function (DUF3107) [Actinobacteria bacterium IMCC26207]MCX6525976.1 DUF3107 domain-containing protein [Actinomycetota bacterium]MSV47547.1 DUF3107 family protein [Actinomycetota bacterium]MSV84076.1 DUF3107 family protein [Actinomycetota bacterium]MSX75877.1 DUF3107 family protein [Actinomycetota bacterium]
MDVRIGVTYSPREIEMQLPEDVDRAEIKSRVDDVLGSDTKVLWLTDRKGREVAVPSSKITYVELGTAEEARPMGFSS